MLGIGPRSKCPAGPGRCVALGRVGPRTETFTTGLGGFQLLLRLPVSTVTELLVVLAWLQSDPSYSGILESLPLSLSTCVTVAEDEMQLVFHDCSLRQT